MSADGPSPATPPVSNAPDAPPLLFEWKRRRWNRRRLALFIGIAAGAHILLFYLFKVGNRAPTRRILPAESVLLLPASDPAAAALVRESHDRLPGQTAELMPMQEETGRLLALVKPYTPTWQDHTAALKPLPTRPQRTRLPSATGPSPLLLPPIVRASPAPRPPLGVPGPVPPPEPALTVLSGLGGRTVTSPPVWPAALLDDEAGEAEFMVEVDASGAVIRCLPWKSTRLDLRQTLLGLRFSPDPGTAVAWGWVCVRW